MSGSVWIVAIILTVASGATFALAIGLLQDACKARKEARELLRKCRELNAECGETLAVLKGLKP